MDEKAQYILNSFGIPRLEVGAKSLDKQFFIKNFWQLNVELPHGQSAHIVSVTTNHWHKGLFICSPFSMIYAHQQLEPVEIDSKNVVISLRELNVYPDDYGGIYDSVIYSLEIGTHSSSSKLQFTQSAEVIFKNLELALIEFATLYTDFYNDGDMRAFIETWSLFL